ncbi:MAG TPA: pyruvate, phosphate dikinase, partial [Vitreimonas sp.]|nr:pyruvate, phosphate dikinase [Vitreimonas sp.]
MTWTRALDHPHDLPLEEVKALVGGKAANLGVMLGPELRLPVPPGFVLTTAACRAFLSGGWPEGLDDELRERMAEVEAAVGRRFGDPADPLIVSVRSGAPVSMPGMMDTILNLGLTDATTAGLAAATGQEGFASACRERLQTMFREIVGVDDVPEDPWQQLRAATEAVFRSWHSERAQAYRRREGIPDDLGTAVTVQAMVFGNLGDDSATGVVFTRNPATGADELYGDVMFGAQGEDVVAGTHQTEPISVLDERLPAVAAELRSHAERLERHYRDLCDIEFTIERGRLWMLQVRVGKRSPQAALRIAVDMAEEPSFPLSRAEAVERVLGLLADPPVTTTGRSGYLLPLVTGLAASPGVASGGIATSPEAAVQAAEAGRSVVLVRAETSPDDVHGMARAVGILTSRGGLASHAAVVARGWGIPAVVGASGVDVRDGEVTVGERILREGDVITIDGASGEVFEGAIRGSSEVVPEARTLLAWAQELGISVGRRDPAAGAALPAPAPRRV